MFKVASPSLSYVNGPRVTLGRFASLVQAAKAHDVAAYYIFGEDAVTNFSLALARKDARKIIRSSSSINNTNDKSNSWRVMLPIDAHPRDLQGRFAMLLPPSGRQVERGAGGDLLQQQATLGDNTTSNTGTPMFMSRD